MKLAIEVSEYDVQYSLRTSIKGETATDFVAKLTAAPARDAQKVTPRRWIQRVRLWSRSFVD